MRLLIENFRVNNSVALLLDYFINNREEYKIVGFVVDDDYKDMELIKTELADHMNKVHELKYIIDPKHKLSTINMLSIDEYKELFNKTLELNQIPSDKLVGETCIGYLVINEFRYPVYLNESSSIFKNINNIDCNDFQDDETELSVAQLLNVDKFIRKL